MKNQKVIVGGQLRIGRVAVTMPQDARRGRRRKDRKTSREVRTRPTARGSRIFIAERRLSEQGESAIPGSKAMKALLLRSPEAHMETY